MMMSYAEAVEFLNPAYNPNVASFFPQPVLISTEPIADSSVTSSNEGSMTVAPESFNGSNSINQPHAVELRKKKSTEALWCEICSVGCNSISVLEKHMMGKKHRKKTGKYETLVLDSVKTNECMKGVEITSVKNSDRDAIPGAALGKMSTATSHKIAGTCSDVVSDIRIPKHQGFSTSVADNTCHKIDVGEDEIMADKRQSTQLKADNSADLSHLGCASKTCIQVCTVCNIFSTSQAELEKHLAGKTHARKVKYLNTLMTSTVSAYPHNESCTLKLAIDTISQAQADPSSFIPVECSKIEKPIQSGGGTAISSPKECTICNIKCNSQEIFQSHLSGRKHASKVRMLGSSVHAPSTKDQGTSERASKRGKVVQFAYCNVCKIYCNSSEILDLHIVGKKHMKQLEKLAK